MHKTALLIMDVQQGIVDRFADQADGLLEPLQRALGRPARWSSR
jgi:hypothetical protein